MKNTLTILALATVIGCGGSGGSGSNTNSQFAGSWDGFGIMDTTQELISLELDVKENGKVTGNVAKTPLNGSTLFGTCTGIVGSDKVLSISLTFPDGTESLVSASMITSGNPDKWHGNGTYTRNVDTFNLNWSLNKQ